MPKILIFFHFSLCLFDKISLVKYILAIGTKGSNPKFKILSKLKIELLIFEIAICNEMVLEGVCDLESVLNS